MDDKSYSDLKTYLRRLGWALGRLPERDRDDIVEETRVHLMARVEQGSGVSAALSALGPAEAYAREFIDQMEVSDAFAGQRSTQAFGVLLRRAHRDGIAALAVVATSVLFLLWLTGVVCLIGKPFAPEQVGLWTSPRGAFFVGIVSEKFVGHELLGNWIYPVAVADIAITWLLGRRIVLWAVRSLAK